MANTIGLTLSTSLQQKLSPAQIQVIRMLEIPACDLQQRVNEELQENPALEEGMDSELLQERADDPTEEIDTYSSEEEYDNPLQNDSFNYDDYIQDDETPDYKLNPMGTYGPDEDNTKEIPFSIGTSFGEYLKSQVYLTKMDKPQRHIAKFVVGNIDEDGYLRRTTEDLIDDLCFREGLTVSEEEMEYIVGEIQRFDPPGVGAHDLKECLLIQLSQKPSTPTIHLAQEVLKTCFDDFSHRRYDHILQRLNITDTDLKAAIQEITRLNPKPGSAWAGTVYDRNQTIVVPDFYVEEENGQLTIRLNNGDIPELCVNREYKEMLASYAAAGQLSAKQKETLRFVRQKIDAAHWFIDALRQRNQTLMSTMQAIVTYQEAFFRDGDVTSLKPLILKQIADITQYDVSTISRVCNSKYVQTEYGIFPLKFFFSEKMLNDQGEDVSTREIKHIITEIITAEDKSNPLPDEKIVTVLRERGYNIARRTVAKYREQLHIPVSKLRREV